MNQWTTAVNTAFEVDGEHGPLTPNNQFFEFQMAHASEASAQDLRRSGVGWSALAHSPDWAALLETVRGV